MSHSHYANYNRETQINQPHTRYLNTAELRTAVLFSCIENVGAERRIRKKMINFRFSIVTDFLFLFHDFYILNRSTRQHQSQTVN